MSHRRQHSHGSRSHEHQTSGVLLDRGWRYDLEVRFVDTFLLHGEIGRLRARVLDLAGLRAGTDMRVLDVGCGTGTLAIAAARRLSGAGHVAGVDPAPRQIAWARSKARRASLAVDFQSGVIEALPFPDASFDTVTSTLMMHHLPDDLRARGLAEIARVLDSHGRLVIADFDVDQHDEGGAGALVDLLQQTGFESVDVEHVTFRRPHRGWIGASLVSGVKG